MFIQLWMSFSIFFGHTVWYAGSYFFSHDCTHIPCIGNTESEPINYQEVPSLLIFIAHLIGYIKSFLQITLERL